MANPHRDDQLELLGATSKGGSVREKVSIRPQPRALKRHRRMLRADPGLEASPPRLFLRIENAGMKSGDASSMWNVYVRTSQTRERHPAGTIAPFGLAGLTSEGGRQSITLDISHLSGEIDSSDEIEVSFEKAYDDVEGEPFWERVALYTTAD
jgi:hypothetical protein